MTDHSDTVLVSLNQGVTAEQVKRQFGFVHGTYPAGIISVDQKGGGAGLKQTRLYLYPDEGEEVLYHLRIGDKGSQKTDVELCVQWVVEHERRKKSVKHEQSDKGIQKRSPNDE